jgi:hypothetical protein
MIENNLAAATPNAFNRRATGDNSALGPLSTLVVGNHWVGDSGFNLMVVPHPTQQFLVMISPLFETHDFTAVPAPAPNRAGVHGTAQIGAVKYSQTVAENVSKNILHEETGMWLNQTPGTGSTAPTPYGLQAVDPQTAAQYLSPNPIMRSGTIPHGNTVHATGVWQQTDFPQPSSLDLTQYIALSNFQNNGSALNFLPVFVDNSNPASMQDNYLSQIAASLKLINRSDLNPEKFINPISFLNERANNVLSLTAMPVTTAGDRGAVINVPFERAFAGPQDFISTFLIETIANTDFAPPTQDGQDEVCHYFQLQYIQSIPLLFPKGYEGKDVIFPHWNINTLIAI